MPRSLDKFEMTPEGGWWEAVRLGARQANHLVLLQVQDDT
jgi:hypothetical protein